VKISFALFVLAAIPAAAFAADATSDWAFMTPDANQPAPPAPPAAGGGAPAGPAAPAIPPGVPAIVAAGKGEMVRPCATCHTPSGMGQPESANLRGLPVNYFVTQMQAFRDGTRKGPRAGAMAGFAKGMTEEEYKEVASYYANLKPASWTVVNESSDAPKSTVTRISQRVRAAADGGTEAVGARILEMAVNPAAVRTAQENAFVAYAPPGSIQRGQVLATTGGKGVTMACSGCHGANLQGAGDVPGIGGRSPVYIARQLYTFKADLRNEPDSDQMKQVVAKLSNDDIVAIGAYVGSRNPS
jgi:cytochrome c553